MNTFQIFEQFRGPLGEEAAKALAQTLGAMFAELKDSVTKEDFRILREASDANFARIDSVLERLADAQARTEQSLQELTAVVRGLVIRTDRHEGDLLELRFQRRLPSYLGLYLRRAKVLQPADLLDEVEAKLDRPEVEDYLRADVLAQGLVDDKPTYVIGEVSYTADADDVERAAHSRPPETRRRLLPAPLRLGGGFSIDASAGRFEKPAPDARAAPPEAYESLISRITGAEAPLTGLSLSQWQRGWVDFWLRSVP